MLAYLYAAWALVAIFELLAARNPMNPSKFLGYIFILISVLTIPAWDVSKFSNGSGVTTYLEFGTGEQFQICMVVSALAFQVSSLVSSALLGKHTINFREAASLLERYTFWGSLSLLLLWAIGQGPSIFDRNSYLQVDGLVFILRPLAFVAPLAGALLFLVAIFFSRKKLFPSYVLGFAWFICLIGVGSRSALLFLGIACAHALVALVRNVARPGGLLGLLLFPPVAVYLMLLSFSATLWARTNPHGLSRMTTMFSNSSTPHLFDLSTWWETISTILISFASIYPIITLSALKPAPLGLLIENSSPFPTEFLGINPNNSLEFLLPWLPKSLLGEFLGVFGPVGLFLVVFSMAFAAQYFYLKAIKNNAMTIAAIIGASLIAAFLLSLQYPSRVTMRIYSLTYLVPLSVLVVRTFVQGRSKIKIDS